ncbi:hypothetical protein LXL04_013115 [Taraxacum kok-saghyz]
MPRKHIQISEINGQENKKYRKEMNVSDDFIPGIDGPSDGVPRVLACFSNNLLRREPLKLVDGGESQRTFVYIKDAIEAVLLMIYLFANVDVVLSCQENPARVSF